MFRFLAPALAVATVALGLGATAPASAAPVPAVGINMPIDGVQEARMTRREMRARRMMRERRMMRRSMRRPAASGNARNPSRPVRMQNQGNTTGGYR